MGIKSLKPGAMAISGLGQPIHLVSKNKCIWICYQQLANISNIQIFKESKLTDGINLNTSDNKKYDLTKVLIDLDDLDISNFDRKVTDSKISIVVIVIATVLISQYFTNSISKITLCQESKSKNLDKLYNLCVGNKSTQVIKQNKSITVTMSKLEEVYIDLWGPSDLPSCSGAIYIKILICKHICRIWTLYRWGKDKFSNAFQAWLPKFKVESGYLMKSLRVDGGGKFLFIKLCDFYKKQGITIKYATLYMFKENRLANKNWRAIVAMKDIMLIDSNLLNNYWAKAMETANYLYNRLSIRSKNHGKLVFEET